MKRIAWYSIVVLATLTILILIWQLREAVVLFLLSLATAAAFHPLIEFFTNRKLPRGIALLLAYLLVIGLLAGLLFLLGGPLIRDLEQASNQLAIGYERIKAAWPRSESQFLRSLAEQLPPPEDLYNSLAGEEGAQILQALLGVTANLFSLIGNLAIILILSLYWSADRIHFERLWLSLVPVGRRAQAREIWRSIERGVGAYIRSEFVQSLLAGILLWLGYRLMGLNYPVLLALLGALAWLIPWFGALLAVIPPLLVGLSASPFLGGLAGVYTLAVLVIMEWVIEPRFFSRRMYSSIILVLVVLALTDAFGLIGLILAPLLAAAIQISFRYLAQPPVATAPAPKEPPDMVLELSALQERLVKAKELLNSQEDNNSPEMDNLMDRLNRLIQETNQYLANGSNSR